MRTRAREFRVWMIAGALAVGVSCGDAVGPFERAGVFELQSKAAIALPVPLRSDSAVRRTITSDTLVLDATGRGRHVRWTQVTWVDGRSAATSSRYEAEVYVHVRDGVQLLTDHIYCLAIVGNDECEDLWDQPIRWEGATLTVGDRIYRRRPAP